MESSQSMINYIAESILRNFVCIMPDQSGMKKIRTLKYNRNITTIFVSCLNLIPWCPLKMPPPPPPPYPGQWVYKSYKTALFFGVGFFLCFLKLCAGKGLLCQIVICISGDQVIHNNMSDYLSATDYFMTYCITLYDCRQYYWSRESTSAAHEWGFKPQVWIRDKITSTWILINI